MGISFFWLTFPLYCITETGQEEQTLRSSFTWRLGKIKKFKIDGIRHGLPDMWQPSSSLNHHERWQRKAAWAARTAAVLRAMHGARFCFHLHPSHPAKQLGDKLWPHAANSIPRLLPLTQRDKTWHWRHPKTVMPCGTWVLFAKRGGTVRGKRPTEGWMCCRTLIPRLSCRQYFLFFRKENFSLDASLWCWQPGNATGQRFLPRTCSSRASNNPCKVSFLCPFFHPTVFNCSDETILSYPFGPWCFPQDPPLHNELRQTENGLLRKAHGFKIQLGLMSPYLEDEAHLPDIKRAENQMPVLFVVLD